MYLGDLSVQTKQNQIRLFSLAHSRIHVFKYLNTSGVITKLVASVPSNIDSLTLDTDYARLYWTNPDNR